MPRYILLPLLAALVACGPADPAPPPAEPALPPGYLSAAHRTVDQRLHHEGLIHDPEVFDSLHAMSTRVDSAYSGESAGDGDQARRAETERFAAWIDRWIREHPARADSVRAHVRGTRKREAEIGATGGAGSRATEAADRGEARPGSAASGAERARGAKR